MSDTHLSEGGTEESAVITELRRQLREAQAELKKRPTREQVLAEIQAQAARVKAAESVLVQFGLPAETAKFVAENVEGEVTEESVKSFLEASGLAKLARSDDQEAEGTEAKQEVAEVSKLGQQVASAGGATGTKDIGALLDEANSIEDINRIMVEAGLAG